MTVIGVGGGDPTAFSLEFNFGPNVQTRNVQALKVGL